MSESLADAVISALRRRGLSVSTAESCTGGLLGGRLTDVPGSSDVFLGGLISYSDAVKTRVLGVPEDSLRRSGAVSEEVAQEMARRALVLFQSDVSVSITGIAGPAGGSADKPVGLVFIGTARAARPEILVRRSVFEGDRAAIRRQSVDAALELLLEVVEGSGAPAP
jgi:nicotinamide-nucleotide amidase